MKMIRFTPFILSLFIFLASSPVFSAPSSQYLFIQTAESGLLKSVPKQSYYKLILYNIHPYVTYFSDRPERKSGLIDLSQFLTDWAKGKNNFKTDAPNVGLHAMMRGKDINMVLELKDPTYHKKTKTLTYKAFPISHSKNAITKSIKDFEYVALFIDGLGHVCYGCGGGGF